jgi:hypothetical protein
MKLEHLDLDPFEPLLRQLVDMAFNSGVKALESKGFRFEDIERDETAKRVFIRGCHYGYDKVQERIGTAVIALEKNIKEKENQVKELHRLREKDVSGIVERIKVLKDRQLILRRIIDTMVYSMLGKEEWVIRRLGSDEIRPIDPKVLDRTLRVASSRNQQTRYNFAVVSDLSTVVQIGDLFEITFRPDEKRTWRILELKEGKVNALLSEILGHKIALTEEDRNALEETLDKGKVKQAERMLRQRATLSQFEKIVKTDHGIDFRTKQEIVLPPDVEVVEDYEEELHALIEDAAEKGFGSTTIEGCLHLVAAKGALHVRRHSLVPMFHLLSNPDFVNRHLTTQEVTDEFDSFAKRAPIVDLVDLSMRIPCGRSIFYWASIPRSRQVDLAMGHIRLFAYFDIEAFLKYVRSAGIRVSWVTGKDSHRLRNISPRIPGSPNAYGVKAEFPSGFVQELMNGFFSRVFLYLTKPSSLLMLIKKLEEQKEKLAMTHSPVTSKSDA